MLKILFWNINRKDLGSLVCQAVEGIEADIVILLESGASSSSNLDRLMTDVSRSFCSPTAFVERFQLFCRDPALDLSEVYGGERISLRRLSYSGSAFLLGIVHVVDRRNYDELNYASQVQMLATEIHREEDRLGNVNTILLGDFNMNPFDQPMNMALGLNAMMTMKCIERGTRKVQNKDYRYFYNPMWSLFGDRTSGPAGTYYHTSGSSGIYGWNMLDQVLLRPDAASWFDNVQILTSAGSSSLLSRSNRPNSDTASDHFPILLTLK